MKLVYKFSNIIKTSKRVMFINYKTNQGKMETVKFCVSRHRNLIINNLETQPIYVA